MKEPDKISNCCQAPITEDGFCLECKEQCEEEIDEDFVDEDIFWDKN